MKESSTKIRQLIWILTCAFVTIVTINIWHCSPSISGAFGNSWKAIVYQWFHGLMLLSIDLLCLSLGSMWNKQKEKILGNICSSVFHIWMLVIEIGLILTLFCALCGSFDISNFYTSFFPILRNESPILTGLLIGVFLTSTINLEDKKSNEVLSIFLITLVIIPFVFGNNLFHLNGLKNPLIFFYLFFLGYLSDPSKTSRIYICHFIIWIVVWLLSSGLMPYISYINHSSLATASRFTQVSDPFLIFAAYNLIQVIDFHPAILTRKISALLASCLTAINVPAFSKLIRNIIVYYVGHSIPGIIILSLTISICLLSIMFAWTFFYFKRLENAKITNRIDNFFAGLNNIDDFSEWFAVKKRELRIHATRIHFVLLSLLVAYLLSVCSLLLTHDSLSFTPYAGVNLTYNVIMFTLFYRQNLVIFNAILIFLFNMFLWAIIRRYFIALVTSSFVTFAWIVASRVKILARDEPIMPSELKMIGAWGNLISMAGKTVIVTVVLVIILLDFLTVYLEKNYKVARLNLKSTLTFTVLFPLIVLSSLFWNHGGTPTSTIMRGIGDDPMFYNQLVGAQFNGSIVQFLNNLDVKVMTKPKGYTRQQMYSIRRRYMNQAVLINRNRNNQLSDQTIIFNLSESFADPHRVPGVRMANNPIPKIQKVKKKNTSGLMVSSGYGGGTANMEYMTLTGFAVSNFSETLATPYTQLVDKLVSDPSITGSFRHSVAIHPYLATFYNRENVYNKFGFNAFYHLNGKHNIRHQYRIDRSPYLSDKTAYANSLDVIHKYKQGQFIQLVSMQNHMPYDSNFYNGHKRFKASGRKGTKRGNLEEYSVGISHTDQAVSHFIRDIDKVKKPVTLVFYGDHLPGTVYGNSLAKDGLKLHETDYFIYSNKYAREHGATQKLTKHTQVVDPNDFIALVAEQTNSKVNWYQAMLTDVLHQLPAFALNTGQHAKVDDNGRTQFVDEQGKFVSQKHWTNKQKQLWHDYKLVQYDVTAGKQYLVRDGQLK